MATITRRLAVLEARAEPSQPLVVLFCGDGESAADAWARQREEELFPPANTPMIVVGWMAPDADTWAIEARSDAQ